MSSEGHKSYVIMVLRVVHVALKKIKHSYIVSNLIRTPDELGLVQGGPTHDEIGLGHTGVSFTSPKSLAWNICKTNMHTHTTRIQHDPAISLCDVYGSRQSSRKKKHFTKNVPAKLPRCNVSRITRQTNPCALEPVCTGVSKKYCCQTVSFTKCKHNLRVDWKASRNYSR